MELYQLVATGKTAMLGTTKTIFSKEVFLTKLDAQNFTAEFFQRIVTPRGRNDFGYLRKEKGLTIRTQTLKLFLGGDDSNAK